MISRFAGPAGAPYSTAVVVNDVVYTAGQIGQDETGAFPPSFEAQARIALSNLKRVVEDAGGSLDTVAKVLVFLVRQEDFDVMNRCYLEVFSGPLPARSTIITNLAAPELLIEIEAIAAVLPREGDRLGA